MLCCCENNADLHYVYVNAIFFDFTILFFCDLIDSFPLDQINILMHLISVHNSFVNNHELFKKSIASYSFYTNTWMCFYYNNYINQYLYVYKQLNLTQNWSTLRQLDVFNWIQI